MAPPLPLEHADPRESSCGSAETCDPGNMHLSVMPATLETLT